METKRFKVAIVYRYIPQYRKRFYEQLKEHLTQEGIDLLIVYGQPGPKDLIKKDAIEIPGSVFVQSMIFSVGSLEFYWQPILPLLKDVDLVIVEQASKLIVNYLLLVQNALGIKKVAFWGHGKNFQAREVNRAGEWIKRILSTKVHWWFAYNSISANLVNGLGYPMNRITNVQNTIDTDQLKIAFENLSTREIDQLRNDVGISSNHVGLFVGGMYPEKRIGFLLDALPCIREKIPDFEMIFIGSGIDANLVKERASKYSWIRYLGPKFDLEKVPYFALSQLFLMPGAVGLAIIDCFALELPLVTTIDTDHGPEIVYLQNGINGIAINKTDDPEVYAQAVIELLLDEERRKKLVEGCKAAKKLYSTDEMVSRFATGIQRALKE